MLHKFLLILTLICTVCMMPSYTNTCAKPTVAFLKAIPAESDRTASVIEEVSSRRPGLEVFPLDLISIQL